MRAVLVAILIALSMPALAQTGARTRVGGDITKDEYLERARRAAEHIKSDAALVAEQELAAALQAVRTDVIDEAAWTAITTAC